jgi:hypothetical protein
LLLPQLSQSISTLVVACAVAIDVVVAPPGAAATGSADGERKGAPAWAAVTLRTRPSMIMRVTIDRRDMIWFVSFLIHVKNDPGIPGIPGIPDIGVHGCLIIESTRMV